MKKICKKSFLSIVLTIMFGFMAVAFTPLSTKSETESETSLQRTITLKQNDYSMNDLLSDYENASFQAEGNVYKFEGEKEMALTSLLETDLISESTEEPENVSAKYQVKFDTDTDIVTLTAILLQDDEEPIVDELSGCAFINEQGDIDALFIVDEEKILLSEMANLGLIENCGWLKNLIKKVVAVVTEKKVEAAVVTAVTTVAATAVAVVTIVTSTIAATPLETTATVHITQKAKAIDNYKHNKEQSLHSDVNGQGYITDQDQYIDWNFGFTTFDEVGCEVIATYNLLKYLGKDVTLADIIYDFETKNIDFDIGFGALGSNPRQIYRYLKDKEIEYKAYSSFDAIKSAADARETCAIVFTTKNNGAVMGIHSIHTFLIVKGSDGIYRSYNGYIDEKDDNQTKDLKNAIQYEFDYAYLI